VRVTLTRDQRVDHCAVREAHDDARNSRELDQSLLEQLLQPLHLPGAVLDQIDPQAAVTSPAGTRKSAG